MESPASSRVPPRRPRTLTLSLAFALLLAGPRPGGHAQDVVTSTNPRVLAADTGPDGDGDGLPDDWEVQFGLDPSSAAGQDGAAGDPGEDGHLAEESRVSGGTMKQVQLDL